LYGLSVHVRETDPYQVQKALALIGRVACPGSETVEDIDLGVWKLGQPRPFSSRNVHLKDQDPYNRNSSQPSLAARVSNLPLEDQIVNFQKPGHLDVAANTSISSILKQVLAMPELVGLYYQNHLRSS